MAKLIKKYKIEVDIEGIKSNILCSVSIEKNHQWLKITNHDTAVLLRDTAPGFAVMLAYLEGGLEDYARVYSMMLLTCVTALPDGKFIDDVCAWGQRIREKHEAETPDELTEDEKSALQIIARAQKEAMTPDVMDELIKAAEKEVARAKEAEHTLQESEELPNNNSENDKVEGQ